MSQKNIQVLNKHLPENAIDIVNSIIVDYKIKLRICNSRKSKIGDYKPPVNGIIHKISINGDLHKNYFLLVFLHEFAHLLVWKKHRRKAKPHGSEWKSYFGMLIRDFIKRGCFDAGITDVLQKFSENPKATIAGNADLWLKLKQMNGELNNSISIGELSEGDLFKTCNGKVFIKDKRIRTRYRCKCVQTNRWYLLHPLADITPVEKNKISA